uniref:Uncharacterized protein n=1 Tax=Musa acuminata subsp. malaccensis TaxID=214687 RepID=A0A804KFA5_MUSAM
MLLNDVFRLVCLAFFCLEHGMTDFL